jgi:2,4-dienoyl-CoA reductase-like NADH-dependent reductase (Old Yellow Enzyme family)
MSSLFSEFHIKDVTLRNRIAVSPMCQYSSEAGLVSTWHLVHLGARAVGGAGLVVAEATAISPEARITTGDAGIWNDAQVDAYRPIVEFIGKQGAVPGIQLAHAGRMASCAKPWDGNAHLERENPLSWEPIGPSAIARGGHRGRVPREMDAADIQKVIDDFAGAAVRALEAGFEWLELHYAHSYLVQSFLSPLSNQRADRYGQGFEGRSRFLLEVFEAVRAIWPERLPLTVRLGVTDFVDLNNQIEEAIEVVRRLKRSGLDLVDVSYRMNSSDRGNVPKDQKAFMAPFATTIGRAVGLPVATTWNIGDWRTADALVREQEIDLVMLGRSVIDDPHWPLHAARALGHAAPASLLPIPYDYALR